MKRDFRGTDFGPRQIPVARPGDGLDSDQMLWTQSRLAASLSDTRDPAGFPDDRGKSHGRPKYLSAAFQV
jgi:hypothetical protein